MASRQIPQQPALVKSNGMFGVMLRLITPSESRWKASFTLSVIEVRMCSSTVHLHLVSCVGLAKLQKLTET